MIRKEWTVTVSVTVRWLEKSELLLVLLLVLLFDDD